MPHAHERPRLPLALLTPSAALVALCVTPIVYVFVRAIGSVGAGEALSRVFTSTIAGYMVNSLGLVAVVTVASLAIALMLAFLTSVTDLPFKRFWTIACVAPLAVPCYVGATALIAASSPKGLIGLTRGWLGLEGGYAAEGFLPAACVLTVFTYPYAYLPLRAAFGRLDRATFEASRALGKGRRESVRRVVFPQLVPAMLTGSLLVSLYTLSEFGAVSLLRYDTFTRVIYQQYRNAFDRSSAALTSCVLIVLVIVILLAFELLTPKHARTSSSATARARPVRVALGRWKYPSMLAPLSVALLAVVGPIATLVIWALRGSSEAHFGASLTQQAASSAALGLGASLACVALAVPGAFLAVRYRRLLVIVGERLTYIGFALPGIVVALGLAFFALWVKEWPGFGWVYQSFAMLVAAYVILFVPQAIGSTRAGLSRVPRSVEEAARGLGKSPSRVFATITLPLAMPSVLAGALLVFISAIKELPATLLLAPTGTSTVATTVWRHMEEADYAQAAGPALALIGLSSVAVGLIVARERLTR